MNGGGHASGDGDGALARHRSRWIARGTDPVVDTRPPYAPIRDNLDQSNARRLYPLVVANGLRVTGPQHSNAPHHDRPRPRTPSA